jgi:hypothetical protein
MQQQYGGSFVMDMAFNYLGLTDAQRAEVTAAIPYAQAVVKHYNDNIGLINTALADINKCAPALQILIDAVARKQAGG